MISAALTTEDSKTVDEDNWKLPLDRFTPLKEIHKDKFRKLPKSIR